MERRRATNAESCRFESCRGYQIERTWPNGEAPGRQSGDASSILAVRSTLSREYAGPHGRADGCKPSQRGPTPQAYSRSLGSEHEWQCTCPASRMVRVRAPQGPPDRRLVAQWNESAALRKQRSRVRISPGRPVSNSSWRSGRSRSPSQREDVGSNQFESHRRDHVVATSFNGRTPGSDPGDGGSSPPVAARFVAP
jgi:hypothetical protein